MKNQDFKSIELMLFHIEKIQNYLNDIQNYEQFITSTIYVDAIIFNLMQIGEIAKKQISHDIIERNKEIPWKSLYGLRNRIVHNYDGIDIKTVYEVITNDLIALRKSLKNIKKST